MYVVVGLVTSSVSKALLGSGGRLDPDLCNILGGLGSGKVMFMTVDKERVFSLGRVFGSIRRSVMCTSGGKGCVACGSRIVFRGCVRRGVMCGMTGVVEGGTGCGAVCYSGSAMCDRDVVPYVMNGG